MLGMNRTAIALLIGLTTLTGCGAEERSRPLDLPAGAEYRSPLGNFTCTVPMLLKGYHRESEATHGDDSATVTFADDYGTLLRIESGKILPADRPDLDGPGREQGLTAFFNDVVFPQQVRPSFPTASVLQTSFVDYSTGRKPFVDPTPGRALFAVVRLSAEDPTGVRRGIFVFPQKGFLYVVTDQEWPSLAHDVKMTDADRAFRLESYLRQTVAAMTFN